MLGLQLGRLPSELVNMSAAEETLMLAYYRDDPWGDHRADIRSAQVSQILWNSNVSKKEKARKLTDFLPFYRKKQQEDPDISTSARSVISSLIMGKK